ARVAGANCWRVRGCARPASRARVCSVMARRMSVRGRSFLMARCRAFRWWSRISARSRARSRSRLWNMRVVTTARQPMRFPWQARARSALSRFDGINPLAGEVEIWLGSQRHVARLTLGALAALEAELGAESMIALVERFEGGRFSSRDVMAVLVAGLRGGGWTG